MRRSLVVALLALATVPAQAAAIVGGTEAPAGKYPAVANVTINDAFGCTGTLIAPEWVLTAGHCSSLTGAAGIATPLTSPPSSFAVTVGTIQSSGAGGEKLAVDRVVVPGTYLLTQGYDTSLLHLTRAARATPTPVAGKGYDPLFRAGVLAEVAGFGVTMENGDAPTALREVDVPIQADASCGQTYSSFEADTQLCAGFDEGGKDACQGDSGGPMFSRTASDRLFVVGATSYGDGCAKPKTPGVYARVSADTLREFIRGNVPGGVVDAVAGADTTPARTYDAATKKVTTNTVGGNAPAAAAFTTSLATDRTQRRTFRARGLRFRLKCSAACTARVTLVADAKTAAALGHARTLGSAAVKRTAAGRTTATLKLSASLARRLTARRGATLRLLATVTSGSTTKKLTRSAVLAGR